MVKMRKIKKVSFALFSLLSIASPAFCATYYFSTSGNNTTGNGTQASPYYSLCGPSTSGCTTGLSPVSLGSVPVNPGDQILFKRGDEWVGADAQWMIDVNGSAGNPIVFGAWGIATSPRMAAQEASAPGGPTLYSSMSVQGMDNSNGWTVNQSMVRGTYHYDSVALRLYVWRTDNLKPDHAAGRDIFVGVAPTDGTNRLVKVDRGTASGQHYRFQDLHVTMSNGVGFSTSYPNTEFINCLSEQKAFEAV